MKDRVAPFTAKKTYLIIGLAFIAQMLIAILASFLIFRPFSDAEKLKQLVSVITPAGAFLLMYVPRVIGVIAFWLIVRAIPFKRQPGSKMGFGTILQLFFIMYAFSSVANIIGIGMNMLSPAGTQTPTDQISGIISTGNIGGFIIVLMLAPVFEELVFRKMLLDRTAGFGETNAILFSAICFGLFHENLTQSLYTFGIGLILGYVYIKTRNVFVTMIMHFVFNFMGTSAMYVLPMMEKGGRSPALIAVVALIMITMVVSNVLGIIFLIKWIRNKKFVLNNNTEHCIQKKDVFKTIYLSASVVVFFALCLFSIVASLFNIKVF